MADELKTTFYLFARPSFIEGMGRILDLGGTLQVYNEHETAAEADFISMEKDWEAVGCDIKNSIKEYERTRATT